MDGSGMRRRGSGGTWKMTLLEREKKTNVYLRKRARLSQHHRRGPRTGLDADAAYLIYQLPKGVICGSEER